MINLTVLGGSTASATSAAGVLIRLHAGKPLALLAYLACAPASTATRSRLVDLLWSDVDVDAGKHALRQTLWYIKKRLGDGLIIAENDHLRLAQGYQCDRTHFLAAIDNRDFESAVKLYTGPFFPDFAAPGGAEFERWADVERAHLCGKFVRTADDVCRQWLRQGNTRPAIALARRARDADPENESLWRLLLECLLAASDRIGAASEADSLQRKLSDDEREPEVATTAILRSVRNVDHARAEPSDARATLLAELVGREEEFSLIISAWERTRAGSAAHIHITAPAGLGKTRLIADVEARLRASRARVVRLRAAPGERQMPFALAAELAASLAKLRGSAGVSPGAASTLVALNPVVSTWLNSAPDSAAGDDVLRRRSLAIHELLVAVSAETPVALLVDDLHWSDKESLLLINSVAAHLNNVSALLVTASRPPSPFPADGSVQQVISLLPLDATEVGAMVASIATLPDESWAEALPAELHGATGGSPLLVLEMLQFALDRNRLSIERGTWHCDNNESLLLDLRPGRALERRVAELDSAARKVLLTLALAGLPTSPETLSRTVVRSEHDVEATLARLEQTGLVLRDGASWLPQHDEIASAVVAAADETSRRDAQRGLATAYADTSMLSPVLLRRSLAHAIAASDDALITSLMRRYVQMARARGDNRSARVLVRDALGPDIAESMARGLYAGLPASERFSWRARMRVAAAVLACAALVAATYQYLSKERPTAENTLLVHAFTDKGEVIREVEVFDAELSSELPLEVDASKDVTDRFQAALALSDPDERRDRTSWIGWSDVERGTKSLPQLAMLGPDGIVLPFAQSNDDDVAPAWAPESLAVVFVTRRWSSSPERGRKLDLDIALADTRSGTVNPLTSTSEQDTYPRISPDGARVAFERIFANGSSSLCTVTIAGKDERCTALAAAAVGGRLVWRDNNEVVVPVRLQGGRHGLLRWTVRSGEVAPIHVGAVSYDVSPDGRVVVFEAQEAATADTRRYVAAVDRIERRRILTSRDGEVFEVVWRASRRVPRTPAAILVPERSPDVAVGVPNQLEANVIDDKGAPMLGEIVDFISVDTSSAVVTPQGVITGKRVGSARIVLATGARLRDTLNIRVVPQTFDTLWKEEWSSLDASLWRPFGKPEPFRVADSAHGSTVDLSGDRNYASGLFSMKTVDVRAGGGVEVLASTRVTAELWQAFAIALQLLPDSSVRSRFINTDAGLSISWHMTSRGAYCSAGAPSAEGIDGLHRLGLGAGGQPFVGAVSPSITDGSWHRWRIQVFPDGRCGFAIDDEPIWISDRAIRVKKPLSVVFSAKSINTKILVGPLHTWTGVAPGVNWAKLAAAKDTVYKPR